MSTATMPRSVHLDVHLVQSFPYSSLNRDRMGAPKTAIYGGVTRARSSSQNGKRHLRTAVEKSIGIKAVRTRAVPPAVAARLTSRGWQRETALLAGQMLILAAKVKGLGIADNGGTNAMLFLPESALDQLADLADEHRDAITKAAAAVAAQAAKEAGKSGRASDGDKETDEEDEEALSVGQDSPLAKQAHKIIPKEAVLKILRERNASVAAFGRMLANESDSVVRGAVHMAHSLSTHAAVTQLDYFTAVDDIVHDSGMETGAGHMGDQRYTSATFYRYASLNVGELLGHLDGELAATGEVTAAFLHAFVTAVLPAKATGTAAFTLPHLVYAAVRTDRPVSLVGAYETPIPASTQGYIPASIRALNDHAAALHRFLGTGDLAGHAHSGLINDRLPALGERTDGLNALVTRTWDVIAKELG